VLSILPFLANGVTLQDYWSRAWGVLLHQTSQLSLTDRVIRFVRAWTSLPFAVLFLFLIYYAKKKNQLRSIGVPFGCLLFWLGCDFVAASSSNLFGHQLKQVLPPLALIAGIGISVFAQIFAYGNPAKAARVAACIFFVITILWLPYDEITSGIAYCLPYPPRSANDLQNDRHRLLADYLNRNTSPDETAYLWEPWSHAILLNAQRRASSRYFNTYLRFSPDFETVLREDFARRPPKYIVINESIFPPPAYVSDLVAREYISAVYIGNLHVFRRNVNTKHHTMNRWLPQTASKK
jgi:hypothetical protein